jgi:succinate dehydrogenase cytochrome b subunit
MADAHPDKRPLSPHITIYRPQITSVLSILNRITGVGMALAAVMIMWWFLAAATSAEYFAVADAVLTSWLGILILAGSLWAFWFHFFNGIRHMRWDAGLSMGIGESTRSGWVTVIASVVVTLLFLVFAY